MIDVSAIVSATDLPGLIGESVRLRKIPGNRWVGRCPIHNEKSASFHVYGGADAHFHCFGCGAHGDAFDWLAERHGMDFKDAAADLARRAGLDRATITSDAPRPIAPPKAPEYPQPHWRPTLQFGGVHLMQGGLPVIVLHDFPGRRLYLDIAEQFADHDIVWFPRIPGGSGQTAAAEQMDLAPIARQAVWIAPTRDPGDARRAEDLERLIVRWRGYSIMARTRRREWVDRGAPILRAELRTAPPAASDLPETDISHDAAA